MNAMKHISEHRRFILNHIEVGTIKVIVDLTKDPISKGVITNGIVRKIMDAALHAMNDNGLNEIIVKTDGYSTTRDMIMKSYDCCRYGSQQVHYRLINTAFEDRAF